MYADERGLDAIVGFLPARYQRVEQIAYRTAWRLRSVLLNVKAIDLTLRSRICLPWFRYAGLFQRGSTYLNQLRGYLVGYGDRRNGLT